MISADRIARVIAESRRDERMVREEIAKAIRIHIQQKLNELFLGAQPTADPPMPPGTRPEVSLPGR